MVDKEVDNFLASKNEVRTIEEFYVNGQISNLEEIIEERKADLEVKMKDFIKKHTKMKMIKKEMFPVLETNPYVIGMYFFKSINPIANVQPKYSPEKLGIVWELYKYLIYRVNDEIDTYTPTLSGFCQFAGITMSAFRGYKASADENMRTIVEKIEDLCFDTSVSMAQMGKIKERMTIYRMKSEQERVEKEQPTIHIHAKELDLDGINGKLKRVKQLKEFNTKNQKINGESNE